MNKDFFKKPFDEDTLIKLEMYEDYVRKWAPVFLAVHRPFVFTINIFDFFSGVGCDPNGVEGSPLIAIKVLMEYAIHLKREELTVNLYFNDYNAEYCDQLNKNIEELEFDRNNIKVHIHNMDFMDAFESLSPMMEDSANLIFLDQFGVKYISKEFFQRLIKIKHTDILFFISSATFKRFSRDEAISKIIGIDPKIVAKTPATHIHKLVTDVYDSFIPEGFNYGIAPFSIKKGVNVYGLIFGSGHPLGLEKFLEVCWSKNGTNGEANFDIEGDERRERAPSLFPELNIDSKIVAFQKKIEEKILSKEINDDMEMYFFMLNSGFLGEHVRPVINKLKKEKRIVISNPAFKCKTILNRNREPKKIIIL